MKFFEDFPKFLKDTIPNTAIPIWVAILAFSVVVILIAITIGVTTGLKKKKIKSADIAVLDTACEGQSDTAVSNGNCVDTPTGKVSAAPLVNHTEETKTTIDKKSIPVAHSIASPNSPIAKPIQNDGKTVYTKGVSGKDLPITSIAKPLVNHANHDVAGTDMSAAARPVKPIIAPPVKPTPQTSVVNQLDKKNTDTTNKSAATPLKSTAVKSSVPVAKPATKAAPKTEVKSSTAKVESKSTAAKADVKPSKIVKNISEDSDTTTFGKYAITINKTNIMRPYKFELRANNGQLLFESEPYKVKPRLNSITAFKGHTKDGSFIIDEDKQGYFRFKLYNIKGELVGVGESYNSRFACENSIESTKRFAESATIIEDATNA